MREKNNVNPHISEVISLPMGPWIHTGMELIVRKKALRRAEQDAYSLWWIEDGNVQIEEDGQQRRLQAPCGIVLSPGDARTLHLGTGATWCMLRFDLQWRPLEVRRGGDDLVVYRPAEQSPPQPSLHLLWHRPIPIPLPTAACRDLRGLLTRSATMSIRGRDSWYQANHRLGLWLLDLRDHLHQDSSLGSTRSRLQELAREHLSQGLTVEQLAQLMGISASQLNRRLRREDPQGLSAREIVRTQRLAALRNHLTNTDKGLALIAQICGYQSVQVLIADFKRSEGMTPAAWRKQHLH